MTSADNVTEIAPLVVAGLLYERGDYESPVSELCLCGGTRSNPPEGHPRIASPLPGTKRCERCPCQLRRLLVHSTRSGTECWILRHGSRARGARASGADHDRRSHARTS